jgi:hypothetical protein
MNRDWLKGFEINQQVSEISSYLLLSAMLGSLMAGFIQLGEQAFDWHMGFLPWLCAVITLEAAYTRHLMRKRLINFFERDWWLYRITEWLTIALLLRILWYIKDGLSTLWMDIMSWPIGFFESFFTKSYNITMITVLITWALATMFAEDIYTLRSSERDLDWERISDMESDRRTARRMMMGRIFLLGSLLVIATAITRYILRHELNANISLKNPTFILLSYFSLAFVFLSLTYFSVLRARWLWQQAPIQPQIASNWFWYGLTFFVLLLLIAFVLPSRYSLGLFEMLRYVLNFVLAGVSFVFQLVALVVQAFIALLVLIIKPLAEVFPEASDMPASAPTFEPPTPTSTPSGPPPILDLLKAIAFWGIFLAFIVYGIDYFFRQNRDLVELLRKIPVLNWLANGLQWIRARIKKLDTQIRSAARSGIDRIRQSRIRLSRPIKWRYINPRLLPPRQRTIFYFLALIRRGSEKGVSRTSSQTPHQYTQKLEQTFPDIASDLETMTDSFIEARYSQHNITEEQAGFMRRAWRRVRKGLFDIHEEDAGPQGKSRD